MSRYLNRYDCLRKVARGLPLLTIFVGCHTSPENSESRPSNRMNLLSASADPRYARVIGRIRVEENGKDFTRKVFLNWRRIDNDAKPTADNLYGYAVRSDDGYFITSLPVGRFKLVYADNPRKVDLFSDEERSLPPDLEFEVLSTSSVYYLGDMFILWEKDPKRREKIAAIFGMAFVAVATAGLAPVEFGPTNGPPVAEVRIVDELQATRAYYHLQHSASNLPVEKVRWPEHYGFNKD